MNANENFYSQIDANSRICPLCGAYHKVSKQPYESNSVFNKILFVMECHVEKKKLQFLSLFDKPINEIFFKRSDAIELNENLERNTRW